MCHGKTGLYMGLGSSVHVLIVISKRRMSRGLRGESESGNYKDLNLFLFSQNTKRQRPGEKTLMTRNRLKIKGSVYTEHVPLRQSVEVKGRGKGTEGGGVGENRGNEEVG